MASSPCSRPGACEATPPALRRPCWIRPKPTPGSSSPAAGISAGTRRTSTAGGSGPSSGSERRYCDGSASSASVIRRGLPARHRGRPGLHRRARVRPRGGAVRGVADLGTACGRPGPSGEPHPAHGLRALHGPRADRPCAGARGARHRRCGQCRDPAHGAGCRLIAARVQTIRYGRHRRRHPEGEQISAPSMTCRQTPTSARSAHPNEYVPIRATRHGGANAPLGRCPTSVNFRWRRASRGSRP